MIDDLGSGGAQRQMVLIVSELARLGHFVDVILHNSGDSFYNITPNERIQLVALKAGSGFSLKKMVEIRGIIERGRYDASLSFLDSSNIWNLLACFPGRRRICVVGERSSEKRPSRSAARAIALKAARIFSIKIIANSHAQRKLLAVKYGKKVTTIYNGYEMSSPRAKRRVERRSHLKLVAVGRIGACKNVLNTIEAAKICYARLGICPSITWYGRIDRTDRGEEVFIKAQRILANCPDLKKAWRWGGECKDMISEMTNYDALIHPSLYEGLPNVICEALCIGLPVLASRVCDNPLLVGDGDRGFLFDPTAPDSIADAIRTISSLDDESYGLMSRRALCFASRHLSVERMAAKYAKMLSAISPRRSGMKSGS